MGIKDSSDLNSPTAGQGALRIVFMGTPDFAVASLRALVEAGFNVVGVITAPDKPAGRGMQLQQSAVKKYAVENGLFILQPEKFKHPDFLHQLKSLQADLQVVVAFRMLPEAVWNAPPLGTVNVHASLLPQYRGAAPINWALINGEKETGITTFKLKHEIDTGNVLLQEQTPIGDNETAGELHDRLKDIGANLLVKTIQGLATGTLQEMPQSSFSDSSLLKHAPKIFTETARINWNESTEAVHDLIRGLSPYPGAFTQLNGKGLKIYRSTKETMPMAAAPSTHKTDGATFLKFACANGWIKAEEVQLEGKKRLPITEFLRGYRIS